MRHVQLTFTSKILDEVLKQSHQSHYFFANIRQPKLSCLIITAVCVKVPDNVTRDDLCDSQWQRQNSITWTVKSSRDSFLLRKSQIVVLSDKKIVIISVILGVVLSS